MSSRLDLIVFGASGFTGKYVVENLVKVCQSEPYRDLRWGIAGRSMEKLQSVLLAVTDINTSNIPILIADVHNEQSLKAMSERTKVLMNCTGPYTVLGEAVVKACIAAGTHYADITAELYFMLKMYKTYHKEAENANVLIVTACGYGSVPAAMGLVHLEKEFNGQLSLVECYSELQIPKRLYLPRCDNTLVHSGTWDSLIHEFENYDHLNKMKNNTFPDDIYGSDVENIERPFFHKRNGKYWFPYPGPDRGIVDMTQRIFHEKETKRKPFHFRTYTTMPALYHHFIIVPAFFIYYYASVLKCFRTLLRKFPGFFTLGYISRKGPSKRHMAETKFSFTLTATGTGWDHNPSDQNADSKPQQIDKSLTVKVSGVDPYNITAIAFIFSAITILKDKNYMPHGGVLTTGAAFYNTSLVERLNDNGLHFETIENKML